jgi:hypothetical protein
VCIVSSSNGDTASLAPVFVVKPMLLTTSSRDLFCFSACFFWFVGDVVAHVPTKAATRPAMNDACDGEGRGSIAAMASCKV